MTVPPGKDLARRRNRRQWLDELVGELLEWLVHKAGLVIPGAGVLMRPLAGKVREELARSQSRALEAAAEMAGMSLDDLNERIAQTPELVPLVIRLMHSAGMKGQDDILRAMGAALGDAVRDPTFVDECDVILVGLADLNDSHASVLRLISSTPPGAPRDSQGRPKPWSPALVAEHSPLPARITNLCLATLISRGLIESPPGGFGGTFYFVTETGQTVLEVLEHYAGESEPT